MLRIIAPALFLVAGCGAGDFQVPAPPDSRIDLDLAVSVNQAPPDMNCFNSACGACSSWANPDGTPAKVGDPCLWNGMWQCSGTNLVCMGTSCPACATKMSGSVCGADGKSIVELTYVGAMCSAYSFGSAIGVCNHSPADKCIGRCTQNTTDGTYACAAHCTSDDGGGTGCQHLATDTCDSLKGC